MAKDNIKQVRRQEPGKYTCKTKSQYQRYPINQEETRKTDNLQLKHTGPESVRRHSNSLTARKM